MSRKLNFIPELVFSVIILLFFILMLFVENSNGRFQTNDFRVLYDAANAFLHGDVVYGESFGLSSGYYKYSPFTLLLFIPYTLFSFKTAAIMHFFVIALSAIAAIILIERIINKLFFTSEKRRIITFFLVFLGVTLHLIKDLHLGNTNTILILLLISTLYYTLNNKLLLAALFFTIAVFTKPYFAIAILPFLLHKKYKMIAYSTIYGIIFLLITIIAAGFTNSLNLHIQWIYSMLDHSVMLESSYTFFYLMKYYMGIVISSGYSYHLFIAVGGLSYWYFWMLKKRDATNKIVTENQSFFVFYSFLLAIIPNILITDNEHFIFSLPLVAFMIMYLRQSKNYWLIGLFVIAIFMYGGNSTDLVGNELTLKIKFWAWLGIGNLIIITMTMVLFYLKRPFRIKEIKE